MLIVAKKGKVSGGGSTTLARYREEAHVVVDANRQLEGMLVVFGESPNETALYICTGVNESK